MDRYHQLKQAFGNSHSEHQNKSYPTHTQDRRQIEPLAQACRDSPRLRVHRKGSKQPFADQLRTPLGGDQDYIRGWLAHIENKEEVNQEFDAKPSYYADGNHKIGKINRESTSTRVRGQGNGSNLTTARLQHDPSSDSSILEAPTEREAHHGKDSEAIRHQNIRGRKRRASSSNSEVLIPPANLARETFEKRPRHKTREDRYEPKREQRVEDDGEAGRPSKKRKLRGESKRAIKKAGENLMRNFSSKSIGKERLTIPQSQGLGMFNNGRASSPVKRRGIPDLAFSEMEFLQHTHSGPAEITQNIKTRNKSREKEKKKAQRAREEITEFFRPRRPITKEVLHGAGKSTISHPRHDMNTMYGWQNDENRSCISQSVSSHDPSDQNAWVDSNLRGVRLCLEQRPQYRHRSFSAPALRSPECESQRSGQATYISWSDSQKTSPSRPDSTDFHLRPESPTPDHIRKSIEKTGIFKDTGIDNLGRSRSSEALQPSQLLNTRDTEAVRTRNLPNYENKHEPLENHATCRSHSLNTTNNVVQNSGHQLQKTRPCDQALPKSMSPQTQSSHIHITQFGHGSKLYQLSDARNSSPPRNQSEPKKNILTATERARSAKQARIRRLQSTLSSVRLESSGLNDRESNQSALADEPGSFRKATDSEVSIRNHADLGSENDLKSMEEPILRTEQILPPKVQDTEASHILDNAAEVSEAEMPIPDKSTNAPPDPAISEPKLQVQTSMSSKQISEHERINRISRLGLPLRGPSVVYRDNSPTIPSAHSQPITEVVPLFLRQLNKDNRGDQRHFSDIVYGEQNIEDNQTAWNTYQKDQSLAYQDEGFADNGLDYEYLAGFRSGHLTPQRRQIYDNAQPVEVQALFHPSSHRPWYPDLTPIREQSDEFEHEDSDDHRWVPSKGTQMDFDLNNVMQESESLSLTRDDEIDIYLSHDIIDMEEGNQVKHFWRPHPHY